MTKVNLVAMDGFGGMLAVARYDDGAVVLAAYDSDQPNPMRRRLIVHMTPEQAMELAHDIMRACVAPVPVPVAKKEPEPTPVATVPADEDEFGR